MSEMRLRHTRTEKWKRDGQWAVVEVHADEFENQVIPVSLELFRMMLDEMGFAMTEFHEEPSA